MSLSHRTVSLMIVLRDLNEWTLPLANSKVCSSISLHSRSLFSKLSYKLNFWIPCLSIIKFLE